MSCLDASLDTRDSELLPCSCSASWKLHSMAINVLGSSKDKKYKFFFFHECVMKLINNIDSQLSQHGDQSYLPVGVLIIGGLVTVGVAFLFGLIFMTIMKMMTKATRAKVATTVTINGHVSSVSVFLNCWQKSDYITDFNLSTFSHLI